MVNAPSVFRFTAKASPERHMRAAEALGADIRTAHLDDAGEVLSGRMIELMKMTQVNCIKINIIHVTES